MTSRENSEAWEFDSLSEGSKRIIEQYTKVWHTKSSKIRWGEIWENLEAKGYPEFQDIPSDIPPEFKAIVREMIDSDLVGMENSTLSTLARMIQTELGKRWASLIGDHIHENGDGCLPGLEDLLETYRRGIPQDAAHILLRDIIFGRHHEECLSVMKSRGLCNNEVEEIPDDIYPFGKFFGEERGLFSWQGFSNTMKHISEAMAGRTTADANKDKQVGHLNSFFFTPALGNLDDKLYDSEISKVIDFIDPGSGDFLPSLMEKTNHTHKSAFHSAEFHKKRHNMIRWTEWVNPYKPPKSSPFKDLCKMVASSPVVEIYGWGGLGKTHLARHFVKQNLDGNCRWKTPIGTEQTIERFETIIWIPSKKVKEWGSWRIGEGTRDPRVTLGLRNENADFHFFLQQIRYHATEGDELARHPTEHVIEILRDKRILVVIDNFEDVSRDSGTLKQFIDFLESIDPKSESRIIITGREENSQSVPMAMSLNLKEFDTSRIQDLMVKAFRELVKASDLDEKDFKYSSDAYE